MFTKQIDAITDKVAGHFRCFGTGSSPFVQGNPLSAAMADKPPMFALGVDVRDVVEFVILEAKAMDRKRARAKA